MNETVRIAGIAAPLRRRILMSCTRLAAPIIVALVLATGPAKSETLAQRPSPPAEQMPPAAPPMPGSPSPLQPGDAFGEQVTLPGRTIIYLKGHTNWDVAFETLVDAFKSLNEYLDKQGIKPNGTAMTIYTQTDDTGFSFQAAMPIAEAPANPPKGDIAVGQSPSGKALKFVHRGSYDAMDFDLRSDHQLSRRQRTGSQGPVHRGICHRPGENEPGQDGGQCIRTGEVKMRISMSRVWIAVFVLAAVALTPRSARAAEKLVTVTGEATVAVAPDTAVIRIGVTSQGKTAREASEANAKQMTAVLAAIKDADIADRDVQTSRLSLQPQYDPNKSGTARLLGFQVTNQLTVKIRDIDKLPAILDRAIGAGANEMSGIEFVVSEQSKLLDQARAEAIVDAHRKAELYARAAGAKVGPIMAISEEGSSPPMPRLSQTMRAGSVPVAPGEQTLRAVVTVSYELAP